MRKHFIDNIRWITVLWLIPYHAACVFRPGQTFYINSLPTRGIPVMGDIVDVCWVWMMPLLFAVAGASAFYALSKRTPAEFVRERIFRLLIPLVLGVILYIPIQTYYAEIDHRVVGTAGSYFEQLWRFFRGGDGAWSGFSGGFTLGNLWFIRYLFYMSLLALPAMIWYKKRGQNVQGFFAKLPVPALAALAIFCVEMQFKEAGAYSFLEFNSYFILGFFVLSNEDVQEGLRKWRFAFAALAIVLAYLNLQCITEWKYTGTTLYKALYCLLRWVSILAIFGMGRQYLNGRSRFTDYMAKRSFGVYLIHQSVLCLLGYYIIRRGMMDKTPMLGQYFMLVGATLVCSFVLVEILRRIPGLRMILGERGKKKDKTPPPPAPEAEAAPTE